MNNANETLSTDPRMKPDFVTQNIRQDVQDMHAYAVQDAAGMVKLDAMENPHRLPPSCRQLWASAWAPWR